MPIKGLLIDMGGVLVNLKWQENVQKMLGQAVNPNDIHRQWISSRAVLEFESGRINFEEFHSQINDEFQQQHNFEDFHHLFMNIIDGPKAGAREELETLKDQFQLCLLSNTSDIHIQEIKKNYGILNHFQELFLSYEMGCMKPESEIYLQSIKKMNLKPEEVAFFDDGQINVDAASQLGMQAYLVHSPQEITKICNDMT